MDYVVYGTGYGATLMLLGYALRTWGPKWRFRDEDERAYPQGELRSARSAWTRFTAGLGAVIATSGVVLILFTFVLMLANPGDSISETVSLVLSGLLLIAVAAWAWIYFDRFGGFGVVRAPAALASSATEPLRYDNRPQASTSEPEPSADDAGADSGEDDHEDETEDVVVEEDEEEADIELDEDEAAELQARYSKFETHHPDDASDDANDGAKPGDEDVNDPAESVSLGEDASGSEGQEPGRDESDARASKFEQHHPDAAGYHDSLDDDAAEEVAIESGEPSNSEDTVASAMADDGAPEEPASEPGEGQPETTVPEEETRVRTEDTGSTPAEDARSDDSERSREDALRRLRERQASRARKADDA